MIGRQVLAVIGYVLHWIRSCILQRMEINSSHGGYDTSFGSLWRNHGDGDG